MKVAIRPLTPEQLPNRPASGRPGGRAGPRSPNAATQYAAMQQRFLTIALEMSHIISTVRIMCIMSNSG